MRFVVSILAFVNLAVWLYFNQDFFYQSSFKSTKPEINADKLLLLTPHQLSLLSEEKKEVESMSSAPESEDHKKKVTINVVSTDQLKIKDATPTTNKTVEVAPPKPPTYCYAIEAFDTNEIEDAQTKVTQLGLKSEIKELKANNTKRYWVYLPPLPSADAAQQKVVELKLLGVEDLFVLQNAKWKNAISFGVFGDEALAQRLLENLQKRGVKDVVKSLRVQGNGNYRLFVKDITTNQLSTLKSTFPKAKAKKTSC